MNRAPDYYRILHVQPDAPVAIIHASYRTLVQRARSLPQAGGDSAPLKELDEAYAVLSNLERRAAYDLQRDIAASQRLRSPIAELQDARERSGEHFGVHSCIFCGTPHGLQRALDRDDECATCASPLCPAERQRLEYSGQRMLRRIPKHTPARLYAAWPQAEPFAATMNDISLNGMQLSMPHAVPINQIVKIASETCDTVARIAHCERDPSAPGRWTLGVEFLTLRFRKNLGAFVSAKV